MNVFKTSSSLTFLRRQISHKTLLGGPIAGCCGLIVERGAVEGGRYHRRIVGGRGDHGIGRREGMDMIIIS